MFLDMPRIRRCSMCSAVKPVSEFHRRMNGYQRWCKQCRKTYDPAYHGGRRESRKAQKRVRIAQLVDWMRDLKKRPCATAADCFIPPRWHSTIFRVCQNASTSQVLVERVVSDWHARKWQSAKWYVRTAMPFGDSSVASRHGRLARRREPAFAGTTGSSARCDRGWRINSHQWLHPNQGLTTSANAGR
jgi:hypothetical protein